MNRTPPMVDALTVVLARAELALLRTTIEDVRHDLHHMLQARDRLHAILTDETNPTCPLCLQAKPTRTAA